MTTTLHSIAIFPIKSLDRTLLTTAHLLESGAIQGDREFAIFDQDDRIVNAKRIAKIHQIRSHYNLQNRTVTLSVLQLLNQPTQSVQTATLHLDDDRSQINQWLSDFFEQPVHLKQNLDMGFPDDPASPGPTIISTQTLQSVAHWYNNITLEEARSRFRTNLELNAPNAFWEDQLLGKVNNPQEFTIGSITLQAINACQRCIVPTRNSTTGQPTQEFQKTFLKMRTESLPSTVDRSHFNHYYRLAINTRLKPNQPNPTLKLGDVVDR